MPSKDRHHLVPKSRCKELGINPNFPGNVRKVRVNKHRAWHVIFGNMTAEEAIEHIRAEWSLDQEAQRTFDRLRGNVELLRRQR